MVGLELISIELALTVCLLTSIQFALLDNRGNCIAEFTIVVHEYDSRKEL